MRTLLCILLLLSSSFLWANTQEPTEQIQEPMESSEQLKIETEELVLTKEEQQALDNHSDANQSGILGY